MQTLPYKVAAFDMDGTFLRDDKSFNRPRFQQLLTTFRQNGGHLVVASGDPLECLLRYFPTERQDLTIVAENGAQILDANREIFVKTLDHQLAHQVINYLVHQMQIEPVISGHRQGYFPKDAAKSTIDHLAFYYPTYELVDNFDRLPDDEFFQISFLVADDKIQPAVQELTAQFADRLVVTPSGNGSMDLTNPGVNKGQALRQLLSKWHLQPADLVAFGDGGNDVSMLQLAGQSYAMPNGGLEVHQVATADAVADNNHDGVLKTIEGLF
ncbi:HAD family hydrolase [Limosilactobacillus caecicola]|uniref:HAD family hydrolase n=1 Tax=Limosilactobacillus caecicola TaxID=2941332 RepID=UPI00204107D2|nr:HAD family hydrolase [Limosilactobacillus caecicola]